MISETIITLRDIRILLRSGLSPSWEKLVQFSRVEYDDDMNIIDGSAVQGEEWRPVEEVDDDDIAAAERTQEQVSVALSAKRMALRQQMNSVVAAPADPPSG